MRLEDFFGTVTLPGGMIKVGDFMTIHNPKMFMDVACATQKMQNITTGIPGTLYSYKYWRRI